MVSFSKEVARKAASTMLMTEATTIDEGVVDAVGEVANMVAGAAKSERNRRLEVCGRMPISSQISQICHISRILRDNSSFCNRQTDRACDARWARVCQFADSAKNRRNLLCSPFSQSAWAYVSGGRWRSWRDLRWQTRFTRLRCF